VGTQALFAATDSLGVTPNLLGLLANWRGGRARPKPTAALRSREVRIDRSAKEPYTTVEVLESLEDLPLRGESVVVQRYGESTWSWKRRCARRARKSWRLPPPLGAR